MMVSLVPGGPERVFDFHCHAVKIGKEKKSSVWNPPARNLNPNGGDSNQPLLLQLPTLKVKVLNTHQLQT